MRDTEVMSALPQDSVRLTVTVRGYVQGVGFRYSTRSAAVQEGLVGFAENQYNGDVLVVAEGPRAACERLHAWLSGSSAGARGTIRRPGRVSGLTTRWGEAKGEFRSFSCF